MIRFIELIKQLHSSHSKETATRAQRQDVNMWICQFFYVVSSYLDGSKL